LLENVTGHLSLGFGAVQADLAALGYNTEWDCIPAAAVGAPHLRDRIFVIATQNDGMDTNCHSKPNGTINATTQPWPTPMAHTNSSSSERKCKPIRRPAQRTNIDISSTQGSNWASEPRVDRMVNGIPNRVDRLRGLGNAVVPQVAQHIGNIIMDMAS
jgi:DNA (cytosine-5)-methyltransferase 1